MGQDVAFESAGIFEPMFAAVLDSTDRIVVFEIRDFDFLGDRIFGQSQDVVGIVANRYSKADEERPTLYLLNTSRIENGIGR